MAPVLFLRKICHMVDEPPIVNIITYILIGIISNENGARSTYTRQYLCIIYNIINLVGNFL